MRRWLTAACLLVAAGPAWCQDSKADPAKAGDAMERARRQAAGPLRVILAAGKPRRKVGSEVEGADEAAGGVRPVATARAAQAAVSNLNAALSPSNAALASTTSNAAPASTTSNVAVATPVSSPTSPPPSSDAAAMPAPPAKDAASPPPPPEDRRLPANSRMPAPPPAETALSPPTPALLRAPLAELGPPPAAALPFPIGPLVLPIQIVAPEAATPPPASTPVAAPQPLRLLERTDPVIPQRVLDEIGRIREVTVELSLRADGTVAGVTLLPPAPRQLQRPVIAALGSWRYDPMPEPRVHRVRLVFSDN